ncbi:hypothetical protein CVT26_009955, partial [Gymnopilus dilepis]
VGEDDIDVRHCNLVYFEGYNRRTRELTFGGSPPERLSVLRDLGIVNSNDRAGIKSVVVLPTHATFTLLQITVSPVGRSTSEKVVAFVGAFVFGTEKTIFCRSSGRSCYSMNADHR